MRDERATTTSQRPAETSHRIVRYLIGGWNTALGAILALVGLGSGDAAFTLIAVLSLMLGVGMLIGQRWALWAGLLLTLFTVAVMLTAGTSYGYSVAIVQGAMFAGLIYAAPAFGEKRD